MPLVAHSGLPTFDRLRGEGHEILAPERARRQDIRELHIGFLNMMPDAALAATERQFLRLVGASNRIAQLFVHPFTMAGVEREGAARERVERFYEPFERLKREGLDALIVTGANVTEADITREAFWEPLIEVLDWGRENVASMLCSCLASHAVFQWLHGVQRTHLPAKRWGVYSHRVRDGAHPLVAGINTRFETPHSRFNDVPREEMEAAGLKVLVESAEGGVLVATSPDGFRFVYFQGHPEYDRESLLKEYKREVGRYIRGECSGLPAVALRTTSRRASSGASRPTERRRCGRGNPAPPPPTSRRPRCCPSSTTPGPTPARPSSTTGSGSSISSPTTTGAAPSLPASTPTTPSASAADPAGRHVRFGSSSGATHRERRSSPAPGKARTASSHTGECTPPPRRHFGMRETCWSHHEHGSETTPRARFATGSASSSDCAERIPIPIRGGRPRRRFRVQHVSSGSFSRTPSSSGR